MFATTLELTEAERAYLLELLRHRHAELQHELHHADRRQFKQHLRDTIALHESIETKLAA